MNRVEPKSIPALFRLRVEKSGPHIAFRFPRGEGFGALTWEEAGERVHALAAGLLSLGLSRKERCAILSSTRLEWILADLAILSAGGVTTTIYPSSLEEEIRHILQDSQTRIIFAEDARQLEKLKALRGELEGVQKVVLIEGEPEEGDAWVISLGALERLGKKRLEDEPHALEEVEAQLTQDHLATLIYTSGTTGRSKGVELTHGNWLFEGRAIEALGVLGPDDHQYLWLPLAHAFGKVLEVAQLQIGFETTVDGRVEKIVENLAKVQPTFMAAAPRIFEKVYNRVVTRAREAGGFKLRIFTWAVGVGRRASQEIQAGREPKGLLAVQYALADRLVFSKLRALFGARLRFLVSGSAALSRDIAEFFHAAGVLILEGYGLTESSAASFLNRPDDYRFGTVGHPLQGVACRLDEDGEILLGGGGIMRGYHNLPEQTQAVFTDDGFLRTGDIGEFDEKGRLRITDRKKDLIKTSGGKYIAPAAIESKLKALCPYIGQVVVHGNNRNYVTALITLDADSVKGFAEKQGLFGLSLAELARHPKVHALVQGCVDELNRGLARFESIKKFAILEEDFSVEEGTLTPSLKVKRKVVEERYKDVLDKLYEGALAEL